MADYPTSLDALTNPTPTNPLDAPSHASQHSDINDICEELEKKVGIGDSQPVEGKSLVGGSAAGSSIWKDIDHLADSDGDTGIEVEQSPDEDIIRMKTKGTERTTIDSNGVLHHNSALASEPGSYPLAQGLIFDCPMHDPYDRSISANHLTPNNIAVVGGYISSAYDFDNDKFMVFDREPEIGTGTFALEFVIRPDNEMSQMSATEGGALFRSTTGDKTGDIIVAVTSDGRVVFWNWRSDGNDSDGRSKTNAGVIEEGKWAHILVVWHGTINQIYVNGINETLTTEATGTGYGTGHELGRIRDSAPNYFRGKVDRVRIWNRNLAISEVRQAYTEYSLATDDGIYVNMYTQDHGLGTVKPLVQLHQTKNFGTAGAFTFLLPSSSYSVQVNFPVAFPAGTTPVVVCTPMYQTSFWVTDITHTGFTFHVGTPDYGYGQTVQCHAFLIKA